VIQSVTHDQSIGFQLWSITAIRSAQGRIWDVLLGGWLIAEGARVEAPKAPRGWDMEIFLISELKMAHFGAFWLLFFQLSCVYYFTCKNRALLDCEN